MPDSLLAQLKEKIRKRMHAPVPVTGAWLARVLVGHYQYYGVPGNSEAMKLFRDEVTRLWRQALRRRSHKAKMTWERMNRYAVRWLPTPSIRHPYPDRRFRVTTQGRSPVR